MSLFQIKDINYVLFDFLNIYELIILSRVNRFYYYLLGEEFWKKKTENIYALSLPKSILDEQIIIPSRHQLIHVKKIAIKNPIINCKNEQWKKHCYKIYLIQTNENKGIYVYNTIKSDDLDLFWLLLLDNSFNVNVLFNISKSKDAKCYNFYNQQELRFKCFETSIKNDSINCFKFMIKKKLVIFHIFNFDEAVANKSHKIIDYILRKKLIHVNVKILKIFLIYKYIPDNLFLNR